MLWSWCLVWLVYLLVVKFSVNGVKSNFTCSHDCVELSSIELLTFRRGDYATYHDGTTHQQLHCIEGNACNVAGNIKYIDCYNEGVNNRQELIWSCQASVEDDVEFGFTNPVCEHYQHSDDPDYVYKGSCILEYSLYSAQEESGELSMVAIAVMLFILFCCCFFCYRSSQIKRVEAVNGLGSYELVHGQSASTTTALPILSVSDSYSQYHQSYQQQRSYYPNTVIINETSATPVIVEEHNANHYYPSASSGHHSIVRHNHHARSSHTIMGQKRSHASAPEHHRVSAQSVTHAQSNHMMVGHSSNHSTKHAPSSHTMVGHSSNHSTNHAPSSHTMVGHSSNHSTNHAPPSHTMVGHSSNHSSQGGSSSHHGGGHHHHGQH